MYTSYTGGNDSSWPDFLKGWSKVDNTIEPLTFRGINFDSLGRAPGGLGEGSSEKKYGFSTLTTAEDITKVLEFPDLVVKGDATAILANTGIRTDAKSLLNLANNLTKKVLTGDVLKAASSKELEQRLRATASSSVPKDVWPSQPFQATQSQVWFFFIAVLC
jgi:hypothetical protein